MIDTQTLNKKWWHKLYKAFFYIFVFVIILLVVLLQPGADVPAPIIYGILLILAVDSLYHELIVRMATGQVGNGMIRSGMRMVKGKTYPAYMGLLCSLCAGLLAGAISLEVFSGDGSDFLIWFIIGCIIATHRHLHGLHDKVKELEKK